MDITYFPDIDTLYLIMSDSPPVETRDLTEDDDGSTLGDFDADGHLVSLTIMHASQYINLERIQSVNFKRSEGKSMTLEELREKEKAGLRGGAG